MFNSIKRTKKQPAKPLQRVRTQVSEMLGGLTGRAPQKGKSKTSAKAKRATTGTRRGTRSTSRKAKSAAR